MGWKHWFSVTITFRFSFHNGLFFSKRNFLSLDLKKAPLWPFIVRNLVNSIRTVESADMLNEKLNRTFEIAYNKNYFSVHWQSECFQLWQFHAWSENFGQFSKMWTQSWTISWKFHTILCSFQIVLYHNL